MIASISLIKAWFDKPIVRKRRRAVRLASPQLAVYYWTGATPRVHHVADISSSGLYLVTEDRWSPGALVLLTLQRGDLHESNPNRWIAVQSKVIRWGPDGVGLMFARLESGVYRGAPTDMENGTDRRRLDRFLSKLLRHDAYQLLASDMATHARDINPGTLPLRTLYAQYTAAPVDGVVR